MQWATNANSYWFADKIRDSGTGALGQCYNIDWTTKSLNHIIHPSNYAQCLPFVIFCSGLLHWWVSHPGNKVPRALITTAGMPMWPLCANELDLEWISLVVAELRCLQDSKSTYYALGHTHVALMGKWPWRCTSTVQEGSHELHLKWIGPAAIELWCPRSLCRLAGRANKEHSIFPLFFLQKGRGRWAT